MGTAFLGMVACPAVGTQQSDFILAAKESEKTIFSLNI